nr:alpha-galactosidase [Pontibacter sp. E15-1]
MTWNFFADNIHEQDIREMADAMVASGMVEAGYDYLFIDDEWQSGRDARNNIIADPKKFPSGMKALADYVHSKGIKLGIPAQQGSYRREPGPAGRQAERKVHDGAWDVLVKPLQNGDVAVAILNRGDQAKNYSINWRKLDLDGRYEVRDLWKHNTAGKGKRWKGRVQAHETKLFRLKKI